MIVERTYWVSVPGDDDPYEVAVAPDGDAWTVTVRRGAESWRFRLSDGVGEGRVWIDGRPATYHWDPSPAGPGRLALDGLDHALEVASEAEHRLAALGITGAGAHRTVEVRAPMPGLVLAIEVERGAGVDPGDGLMIIEAMKMENEITAPVAGVVAEIDVEAGQAVEQGALLLRIEPPEETP